MAAVAQSHVQDDVHPLLRHPRPIKRDSAKAHRMLDLIADSEEALKGLHRERSLTTRWLERPMYEHLEVSDSEEEKEQVEREEVGEQSNELQEEAAEEKVKEDSDSDLLDKWTNPDRPTSSFNPEETLKKLPDPVMKLDTAFAKRRPQPLARPVSYNPQQLLSPQWVASPATISPNTSRQRPVSSHLNSPDRARSSVSSQGSCECEQRLVHPATWPYPPKQHPTNTRTERPTSYHPQSLASLDSPPMQPRPRPTSFATYHQRNRSGSKIASSRGLRNNSYPTNFSLPTSAIAPKAVAGEDIENDMVYQRFGDDEVGPPTPITSATLPLSPIETTPIEAALHGFEANNNEKSKPEKKSKNRWSTIPQALKNFGARRRDSAATQEPPKFAMVVVDLHRMNLTQENLHNYETGVSEAPTPPRRISTLDLIPTPAHSPFDIKPRQFEGPLPAPFAPWADGPPSPAATADRRRSSGNSLSPKALPSRLSVENVPQVRPVSLHSRHSSVGLASPSTAPHRPTIDVSPNSPRAITPSSRKNTPALDRTCILCKTAKPPCEFVERRITANCWHEPATCVDCLQNWVRQCVYAHGWEACTCPECGEVMAGEDVGVYVDSPPF
ncbi:hypothetical protein BDW02DRAFT_384693 [Decorospora gaudefroyi]|uniref:RING-type domain-containing protein n=1 Tax=Decorospora gaudefroyi TaxID=184978 RepID=A0A6A5K6D4_9PLEO|nr:hypothetical protein BDW02DRAFT_384693 [Decorospora gaudefroyi]